MFQTLHLQHNAYFLPTLEKILDYKNKTHFEYAGAGGGYYISKGFFDTISKSIDEAAEIDGATKAQIFWQIIHILQKVCTVII